MLKVRCLVIVLWELQMSGHLQKPQTLSNMDFSMQIHHFYWGPSRASGKIGDFPMHLGPLIMKLCRSVLNLG